VKARRSPTEYRAAERLGRLAESLCRLALRLRFYRIVARRLRMPAGEIDILAERDGCLVVVEVKARADIEAGLAAVSHRSWQRRARAAAQFIATRPEFARHAVRFDLMLVPPGRFGLGWPQHLPDVWRNES
jgi:putative endonuclease